MKVLSETINQTVNKKPGETIDSAIRNAAREVQHDAPNADVNFVIPKEEINEEGEGLDLISQVNDYIIKNWGNELEDPDISTEAVKDMIQDAYIQVTGMEIQDKGLFRQIMNDLHKKVYSESVVLTKKQIKEMKSNKRIAEAVKVVTKKSLLNSLK
jgi:hypothetical protein